MNFNKDINSFYLNIAIQRTSLNLYTTLADGIAKNGYSIDDMSNMSGLSKKTIKDILKMKSKIKDIKLTMKIILLKILNKMIKLF